MGRKQLCPWDEEKHACMTPPHDTSLLEIRAQDAAVWFSEAGANIRGNL